MNTAYTVITVYNDYKSKIKFFKNLKNLVKIPQ